MKVYAILLGVILAAACGDDGQVQKPKPLPKEPVLNPNPQQPFVFFKLTAAGSTNTGKFDINNGGQNDLKLKNITLAGDSANVFSDPYRVVSKQQDDILPADTVTVKSTDTVNILVDFAPTARGIYLATVALTSNADNLPALTMNLIATGSTAPINIQNPDMEIESSTVGLETVDAQGGQGAIPRVFNLGGAPLQITSMKEVADANDAFSLFNYQPGKTCVDDTQCEDPGVSNDDCVLCSTVCPGQGSDCLPQGCIDDDTSRVCQPFSVIGGNLFFQVYLFNGSASDTATVEVKSNNGTAPGTITLQGS